tara:strand:+ start:1244 stop:2569 length:1326 start_codon:yes stop_codon:yes gene_type:complete
MKEFFVIFFIFLSVNIYSEVRAERETRTFKIYGTVESEISSALNGEGLQKSEFVFNTEVNAKLNENLDLTALVRVRDDFNGLYNSSDNPNSSYATTHYQTTIAGSAIGELREFYTDFFIGNTSLRIGKQQVVWGQTDGLKVLDVVNPQSFQEFILDDFESSRIPLWTLNADISLNDNTSLQFLWIPDLTYHELPSPNSLFEFKSPLLTLTPSEMARIKNTQKIKPKKMLEDSDMGVRLAIFRDGWDITFNYFYHYDDFPLFDQSGDSQNLNLLTRYKRNQLFGGSLTKAFKNIVLRSEYGYSTNKYFLSRDVNGIVSFSETPEFKVAVAFDYNGDDELFVSGQLLLSDVIESGTQLSRDELETSATLLVRKSLFNNSLILENFLVYSLNNEDGIVRPKFTYEYKSNISIWGGFDIFYGDSLGYFGQFKGLDRFNLGVKIGI